MRILYIAKHGNGGNQDEEAVAYWLQDLGHSVFCLYEDDASKLAANNELVGNFVDFDLLLFHKWKDFTGLKSLAGKLPRVFWYWDLVDFPSDPSLSRRCKSRINWMANAIPNSELGFCTDGDWVFQGKSGKLHWLMQGANPCDIPSVPAVVKKDHTLLFTGEVIRCGEGRYSFVDEMVKSYGLKLRIQYDGMFRGNLHQLIAQSDVVLAPDAPVSGRYWSNRVYLSLGFKAFMLHPYTEGIAQHYEDRKEIVYYRSRAECHELIDYYLSHPRERDVIATAGFERTMKEHTYRNRLETLLDVVKARLGVG